MIITYARGHKIYFKDGEWFYFDNNEKWQDQRPCKKCGKFPTEEGFDYCLGYIKGATSPCCGHGIENPYIIKEGNNEK